MDVEFECHIEHVRLGQGGVPSWAARAAALARGAGHPDALSEGAIPPPAARAAEFVQGCVAPLCIGGGGSPPAA